MSDAPKLQLRGRTTGLEKFLAVHRDLLEPLILNNKAHSFTCEILLRYPALYTGCEGQQVTLLLWLHPTHPGWVTCEPFSPEDGACLYSWGKCVADYTVAQLLPQPAFVDDWAVIINDAELRKTFGSPYHE